MRCKEGRVEGRIWEFVIWIFLAAFVLAQFHISISFPDGTFTQTGTKEDCSFEAPPLLRNTHPIIRQSSPTTTISSNASSSTSSSTFLWDRDWFESRERWTSNPTTNSCYILENICHSTHQWFYDTASSSSSDLVNQSHHHHHHHHHHQPPLILKLRWQPAPGWAFVNTLPMGYPANIRTLQSIPTSLQQRCLYSPIANHLVLFSFSNHMLGEFYIRVLMGLWDIVSTIIAGWEPSFDSSSQHTTTTTNNNYYNYNDINATLISEKLSLFLEQTQFYMHLEKGEESLLDSHGLFMNIFQSNPLLHFKNLLDNTDCRCLKRLILCGYYENPSDKDMPLLYEQPDYHHTLVLEPFRYVGNINHGAAANKRKRASPGVSDRQRMRQILRDWTMGTNPLLQDWVDQHRQLQLRKYSSSLLRNVLKQQRIISSEWKVIGLAQRSKRRRWLHIYDLQQLCNRRFLSKKIICVVVNIEEEEWANPVKHVVAHGGLDVLMGIHGAQLTEALWMPPHSLVVEFLPWIPPDINWGKWTKWVHRPTPLGEIFSQTDLNHIGYPLRRDSAPYCKGNVTRACFGRPDGRWDNRDFVIHDNIFIDVIQKFVVKQSQTCADYQRQAGDDYVLYNVNCIDETKVKPNAVQSQQPVVKHYYRDEDWATKKEPAKYDE